MELQTKLTKTNNGHKATTDYSLGMIAATEHEKGGERVLRISTAKEMFTSGVIESRASVHTARNCGLGYVAECHAMGLGSNCGDYNRTIARVECKRITEKDVRAAHAEALKLFQEVLDRATAHYANQQTDAA